MQPPVLKEIGQSHSREFYRAVVGNSIDLIAVLDEEGTYTFVGDSVTAVLGYVPEELVGVNALSLVHPADLPGVQLALAGLLAMRQTTIPHFRFKAKDGEWRWLECTGRNMLHNEHVRGILTSARDVTAATQLAYDNDYHQAYYESLFFEHPDTVFTLNQKGEFQQFNKHLQTLTGYSESQLLGTPYTSLLHPDYLDVGAEAMQKVWSGEAHTIEVAILTQEGTVKYVSVSVMPVYFRDELQGAQGIAKDITEQKSIQRENEKLSLVASKTVNGVVIMNPAGKIEWVNDGFCRLTGYDRHEVVGHIPSELLQGSGTDPKTSKRIRSKYESRKPFSEEVLNYRKTGEKIWFYIDVTPIFDQEGNLQNYIAIETDITEKKEAEEKLVKMADDLYKHNLDLQQFTYIISHNLRAPVANALGLAQLINKLPKETANYDAVVQKLQGSIEQLDIVVKDINQILSLRESGRVASREKVHLKQVCQEVLQQFNHEFELSGAQVSVAIDPSFSLLSIRAYLYSILYNLVSNSLKYRSDTRPLKLEVRAERDKRGFVLTVSDNGSGMDMHLVQHQLFQLYKRFHPNTYGKGTGLFLVKTQVQALSGKIEVESAPDQGTTFKIYLGAKNV
ncbi:PAS domain-containing sensor histidine kinase [Pontibacter anaerobius]|uniref:histidine kinase n=1 Tax=Pontibacter anaerobius TaxID=2993940 RepID=A0ABT3RGC6_9BACT|nr:PAS domain S-box protein [Pontibacter anaerobius]MCX2740305.1 PAS domain S-box protein [Pontibacter anaerobius]